MKIALVTIQNANNYGALLQLFATQHILKKFGSVEVVNYENRHISRSFDLIRFKPSVHGIMGLCKDVLRVLPRRRAIKKFKSFIGRNVKLTKDFSFSQLMSGAAADYDVYVAGSDQIWNPTCVSDNSKIDPGYFLTFAENEKKLISYASSMGGYRYTEQQLSEVTAFLLRFDALSVREKDTKQYLERALNRKVEHVLDPTLLLERSEWLQLLPEHSSHAKEYGDYILLYTVPKSPLISATVRYIADKLKLKVVALDQGLTAGAKVNKQVRDAGPIDFIDWFSKAKFVVTDSFHGTCFAVNFEVPFVAVSPGVHSNRVKSLLDLIGLEDRMVSNLGDLANIEMDFSYEKAVALLSVHRDNSIKYLERALNEDGK